MHVQDMRLRPVSLFIRMIATSLCLAAIVTYAKKVPPPLHSVDLNAATEKQLEQLPGVGPTTAKAIVEFRTKSGRFRRIEDLLVIRGISESKLERIRPYVFIGPPPKKSSQ